MRQGRQNHILQTPFHVSSRRFLWAIWRGERITSRFQLTYLVTYLLVHLVGERQQLSQQLLHLPLDPSASPTPGPGVRVHLVLYEGPRFCGTPASRHQGWKQELTGFSPPQELACVFQPSLALPCGLQAPGSEVKTTALVIETAQSVPPTIVRGQSL